MPEASEKGIEGEIRCLMFIFGRSRSLQAQVGSALFAMGRYFSLFIPCVATYNATFS
jgi:hypothetical protein